MDQRLSLASRPDRRERITKMGILVIGLIGLALIVAGVAGIAARLSAHPATTATPPPQYPGLTELGAAEAVWRTQHKLDPAQGSSSFLPRNRNGLDRFVNVAFDGGHVYGFIMQFDAKTLDEVAAKVIVRAELPPDAKLVFDNKKYVGSSDIDDQCDLLQFQSAAIGSVIPSDRQGIVTVVIWSPGPHGEVSKYDKAGITSINLIATGTLGDIPIEC
ncbi:MAG: hypothetical protein QOJ10_1653 [Chloroflexota bacterium]|nr:hypothetical protein [Chloroflexota bacterium]